MRRRTIVKFLLGFAVILLGYSIIWMWNRINEIDSLHLLENKVWSRENSNLTNHGKKIILAWTTFFSESMVKRGYLESCPQADCIITDDRNELKRAHAIVFHMVELDFDISLIPERRFASQRYVFLSHESPGAAIKFYKYNMNKLPHYFNWTMTYRLDSDVPWPYFIKSQTLIGRHPSIPKFKIEPVWASKKATSIGWFVSNCDTQSKRGEYVNQLKKFIAIDIYGDCGILSCPRTKSSCENLLSQYKFYIAFENSICKDYITEKIWARYTLPSIPIVLKREIYSFSFPSSAFIAVDDFENVKQLADYLQYLAGNKTAYAKYFDWRERGIYFKPVSGFCKLCEMLHEIHPAKSYENLWKWFYEESYCDNNFVPRILHKSNSN